MRLEAEFIPMRLRYSSFYRIFNREEWSKLRDEISSKSSGRCQICGETEGIMNLDAAWSYDDEKHIQKLEGLVLLCEMCHYSKHLGIANTLADKGMLDYNKLIEHFCKVNNCSREEFEENKTNALETWEKRSQHKWKRDIEKCQIWKKNGELMKTIQRKKI